MTPLQNPIATISASARVIAHGGRTTCQVTAHLGRKGAARQFTFRVPRWADRAYASYPDATHGFVLITSEPAAGQMEKEMFASDSTGAHWHTVANVTDQLRACYPNGITFRSASQGWLTATYHGDAAVPIYHTEDGGKNWVLQRVALPAAFAGGYGDPSAPIFHTANFATMRVLFVKQGKEQYSTLITRNFGRTWYDGGSTFRMPFSHGMPMQMVPIPRARS